jgi:hypothetical protein
MTKAQFVKQMLGMIREYEETNDEFVEVTVGIMGERTHYTYDGEKFVGPTGVLEEVQL